MTGRNFRIMWPTLAVLGLCVSAGCTYTVAGTKLPPLNPPAPSFQPRVEHTVGDFAFTLEGGKMVTSNFVGRVLNNDLMAAWKKRGYISDAKEIDAGAFSRTADYDVTLSGTQYGESSIAMQILSGLTLFLFPYTVSQHYDIQYTVEDPKNGTKYHGAVQEEDKTYVEFFLLFALPVAQRGHRDTIERMGDHLYDQLHRNGAFQHTDGTAASP